MLNFISSLIYLYFCIYMLATAGKTDGPNWLVCFEGTQNQTFQHIILQAKKLNFFFFSKLEFFSFIKFSLEKLIFAKLPQIHDSGTNFGSSSLDLPTFSSFYKINKLRKLIPPSHCSFQCQQVCGLDKLRRTPGKAGFRSQY